MRLPVILLCSLVSVAAAEDWKARLADVDPGARVEAAEALAQSGAADAVPDLVECLIDRYAPLRAAAARALGRAGSAARPALPELKRLLADDDRAVRAEALAAIARIGDLAAVADVVRHDRTALDLLGTDHEDVLRALLRADSWHVRLWVVQLKHVRRKPPAAWTEPLVRLAADDPAHAVRVHALLALTSAPGATPHLRNHLANTDPRMRGIAVAGLPEDLDDVTARAVTKLLVDPVPQLRARAAYALRARPDAAAAVEKLLDDKDERVRETAAVVLASQGTWRDDTGPVVVEAALRQGFKPPFPLVVSRNLRAGRGSGMLHAHTTYPYVEPLAHRTVLAGDAAVPHLTRMLDGGDEDRRGQIAFALGQLGAREQLEKMLGDPMETVRIRAAFSLLELGNRDFATMREVIGCLDGNGNVEMATGAIDWPATAADALVAVGEDAVPLLEARLREIDKPPVKKVHGPGLVEIVDTTTPEQERIEAILKRIRKKR